MYTGYLKAGLQYDTKPVKVEAFLWSKYDYLTNGVPYYSIESDKFRPSFGAGIGIHLKNTSKITIEH